MAASSVLFCPVTAVKIHIRIAGRGSEITSEGVRAGTPAHQVRILWRRIRAPAPSADEPVPRLRSCLREGWGVLVVLSGPLSPKCHGGGDGIDELVVVGRPPLAAFGKVYPPRGVVAPALSADGVRRPALGSGPPGAPNALIFIDRHNPPSVIPPLQTSSPGILATCPDNFQCERQSALSSHRSLLSAAMACAASTK